MTGGTSPRRRTLAGPKDEDPAAPALHLLRYDCPVLYYELGLVVLIGLFGVCYGKWKYAWKGAAFYALVVLLTFWIMDTMTGTWRTMFIAFLGLFHKVYPCGMLSGIVISTTKVSEFFVSYEPRACAEKAGDPAGGHAPLYPHHSGGLAVHQGCHAAAGCVAVPERAADPSSMTVECIYVR